MSCPWTVASDAQIYPGTDWISALLVLKGCYYKLATLPFVLLGAKGPNAKLDHGSRLYASSSSVGIRSP